MQILELVAPLCRHHLDIPVSCNPVFYLYLCQPIFSQHFFIRQIEVDKFFAFTTTLLLSPMTMSLNWFFELNSLVFRTLLTSPELRMFNRRDELLFIKGFFLSQPTSLAPHQQSYYIVHHQFQIQIWLFYLHTIPMDT